MLICTFVQRTKIHKIMGIHFEPHAHKHKRPSSKGASRNQSTSLDLKQELDLESQHHKKGTSSPDTDADTEAKTDVERTDAEDNNEESTTALSEEQQATLQRRRLSKRPSLTYARPEDLIIVVPGQESEPEDSIHAKKSRDAQKTAANLSRRNSIASARSTISGRPSSVHSATTTYTTVSVTTEGGRKRRRLSKRRARVEYGGSVVGGYESDASYRSRRRLTKAPSVRSRRSASIDRCWIPGEDFGGDRTPTWNPSEGRPRSIISARNSDSSTSRFSYSRNVGRGEGMEIDGAPQYCWDPVRGWIEHGAKST